jgi:membrane protein
VNLDSVRSVASRLPVRLREHNLTLVSAGVAFYAFLAFVPMLIALVSIYGLVANPADVKRQVNDVAGGLPDDVQTLLTSQLTSIVNANRAGVSLTLVVAIVVALWSASGGMGALITGINVAHERTEPEKFVAKRGKALLLTVAAIVFLAVVILLIAFLPNLIAETGLGTAGRVVLDVLRWPLIAVVMLAGIGALYRLAPTGGGPEGRLGFVTPGAVVATIGWLLASALFALYTSTYASYSETYGSLAAIVVMLLWLYLSSLVVLIGAEVDAEIG